MTASPNDNASSVLNLIVKSEGSEISEEYSIISVEVSNSVNRIPSAVIVFQDGDMSDGSFEISESDKFKPGAKITVEAGYGSDKQEIFSGIVVKHSLSIYSGNSRLRVECKDEAIAMTQSRKNANFLSKKDSDIISSLIGNYSSLSSSIESTSVEFDELVQYYCSDWDFLLSRADFNGYLVTVESGKVTVKPPTTSGSATLSVEYGTDLLEFQADLNAPSQIGSATAVAWDPSKQEIISQKSGDPSLTEAGDISSKDLADVLSISDYTLQSSTILDSDSVKTWANAQQVKSSLSRLTGTMKFQGSEKAKPGAVIELKGVGSRFNGNVYLTGVTHNISEGNWFSEAEFGLSPEWHTERPDVSAPDASGMVPGVTGLSVGKVLQLDSDPLGESRIKISIPTLQNESEGVWARMASFSASTGTGSFYIPEVDDEVVVGYFNNDPSSPVILGSMYSSKLTPPYDLTADNYIRAFVSKSKIKIEYDDENKVLTLETPEGNSVVLSDNDKSIVLSDQNSNSVKMESGGITLDSPKDITISSSGKISLSAATGISAKSDSGDVELNGLNVNATAQVGFKANGSATAEISASGQTTVKGAMVMIN